MTLFGIKVKDIDPEFIKFIVATDDRLRDNNVIRNPYKGGIKKLLGKNSIYLINMLPLYPNYTPFIWLIGVGVFWWHGLHWLHIPIVLLGSLGLCWSKFFIYPMFRLGLKKSGSESKIKLITTKEVMEVFFRDGAIGDPAISAGTKKDP